MFGFFGYTKDAIKFRVNSKTKFYLDDLVNNKKSSVSMRNIAQAHAHDKKEIEKLKSKITEDDLVAIEEMCERFNDVKCTKEWEELISVKGKIKEYEALSDVIDILHDEMISILKEHYFEKYKELELNNKYYNFYNECNEFVKKYKDKYIALVSMNSLRLNIEEFSEYIEKYPWRVKDRAVR